MLDWAIRENLSKEVNLSRDVTSKTIVQKSSSKAFWVEGTASKVIRQGQVRYI